MSRSKEQAPLIVEPHPIGYNGYPFVTLLRYNKETVLAIIDNRSDTCIQAFVLDLCGPERVCEQSIIAIVDNWYNTNRDRYPISIEFSKLGISAVTSKLFRTYSIDCVTRIIGPVPSFNTSPVSNPKRRKRKDLPKIASHS